MSKILQRVLSIVPLLSPHGLNTLVATCNQFLPPPGLSARMGVQAALRTNSGKEEKKIKSGPTGKDNHGGSSSKPAKELTPWRNLKDKERSDLQSNSRVLNDLNAKLGGFYSSISQKQKSVFKKITSEEDFNNLVSKDSASWPEAAIKAAEGITIYRAKVHALQGALAQSLKAKEPLLCFFFPQTKIKISN